MGVIGGVTITSERLEDFRYSYPTIRSGLILLVHGDTRTGIFSFFDMFETALWMAILGATILVAHLIWLFERDEHSEEYPKGYIAGMKEALWYSFAMLFFANDKPLKSLPARIVALAFWMMMVIIIASYTANLTILITSDMTRIQSVTEIDGLKVRCDELYAPAVAKYNPYIEQVKMNDKGVREAAIEALEGYEISAIVVEKLPGQYIGADNCEVLHTEEVFYDLNYGMIIGTNFPAADLQKLDDQIVSLHQNVEYMKELTEDYIYENDDCSASESEHQLDYMTFIGLWILLFATIGIASLILGVDIFLRWRKRKQGNLSTEVQAIEPADEMEALIKELDEQAQLIAEIKKLV